MTNEFLVQTTEILLLDEGDFLAHGGERLHFGHVDREVVSLQATGTAASIGFLARTIIGHRTAAH
jgi:hypothetical protein